MAIANDKREGFTKIPNVILDDPELCARDKLVLCSLISHAYGKKTKVYPSQLRLAGLLGMNRKTIRAALASLVAVGYIEPHGHGKQGAQETYTLHIERKHVRPAPIQLSTERTRLVPSVPTKQTAERRQLNKTPAAISANGGTVEADSSLVGSRFANAYEGLVPSVPMFTKAEVNELFITPEGKRVNGDFDDLEYDLDNTTLLNLGGKRLNKGELQKLVDLRGVEFCQLWQKWLTRKVAWYHERGQPVESPAGLYRRAVEGAWQVDPAWPEFDEAKHTIAARIALEDLDVEALFG